TVSARRSSPRLHNEETRCATRPESQIRHPHCRQNRVLARNTRFLVGLSAVLAGPSLTGGDFMTIMDGCCARAKVHMAVTVSALVMWASTSPAAADNVRWSTVVGIVQAGNLVGNIPGGGQPWTTLGGHASVDLSAGRAEFEVRGLVLAGG